MNSEKTGQKGEQIVENILRDQGYMVSRSTELPRSGIIEAERPADKLLLRVKTEIFPNQHSEPSGEEIRDIMYRAAETGKKAMLVEVVIDPAGNLVDIMWRKF